MTVRGQAKIESDLQTHKPWKTPTRRVPIVHPNSKIHKCPIPALRHSKICRRKFVSVEYTIRPNHRYNSILKNRAVWLYLTVWNKHVFNIFNKKTKLPCEPSVGGISAWPLPKNLKESREKKRWILLTSISKWVLACSHRENLQHH